MDAMNRNDRCSYRPGRLRAQRSRGAGRRGAIAVSAFLAVAGLLVFTFLQDRSPPSPSPKPEAALDGPMTEEERRAYVRAHVKVEDLEIGPDLKAGAEDPVAGLLRVRGQMVNTGGRAVERVIFALYPKDEEGRVIASHLHDAVRQGGPLEPGERRDFRFTIPNRGGAGGAFDHELR